MNHPDSLHFSIIIPTYHRPKSVIKLAEQLRQQKNADSCEIIVVDDSSLTALKEQIEQLNNDNSEGIPVLYLSGDDEGPGSARNTGAHIAKGEFLIFLDDDCQVSPHWLSFIQNEMRNASADIYYGPVESKIHSYAPFIQTVELKDCPYRSTNIAFRNSLFKELGGFDPNLSRWSEGWDLVNRARRHGAQLKYTPQWPCSHTPIYTSPKYFQIPQITQSISKMTYLMAQHRDSSDVQNYLNKMFASGLWHSCIRTIFFASPLFFMSTKRSILIFLLCSLSYDVIRLLFIQQELMKKGYRVQGMDSIKYIAFNWSEDLKKAIIRLVLSVQRFRTRKVLTRPETLSNQVPESILTNHGK